MQFGEISLHPVSDGSYWEDGGRLFGLVPRTLWGDVAPPDEHNRLRMELRCLLIQTHQRCILVGTGYGDKLPEGERTLLGLEGRQRVLSSLERLGVGPQDVDIVINTIDSDSATQDLKRVAFGGHLACVAGFPDFSKIEPFTRAISIHESALGGAHLSGDRTAQADLARMGKELIELVREEKLSPMLTKVISLEEIPQALISLSQRHVRGKIVARPDF